MIRLSVLRCVLFATCLLPAVVPSRFAAAEGPAAAKKPKSARASRLPRVEYKPLPGFRDVRSAVTTKVEANGAGDGEVNVARRGYLGLSVMKGPANRLVVDAIAPESPAARLPIKAGDVVLQVGGHDVTDRHEFRDAIHSLSPGDEVTITWQRGGRRQRVTAVLDATSRPLRPGARSSRGRRTSGPRRGVLGVNIGESRKPAGIKLTSVFRGTAAEKSGLKIGDVIVQVDGKKVTDAGQLRSGLRGKEPGDRVTFVVVRNGMNRTFRVTLGASTAESGRSRGRRTTSRRRYWTRDRFRLAVIGIEYPDVKHNPAITPRAWEDSLYSRDSYKRVNATGQVVFGSVNDYYHELSVGRFQIEGKMFDWVEVGKKRADYSLGTGTGSRQKRALLTEALEVLVKRDGAKALDDFDGIIFLYAGARYRTTRGGVYWPHRSNVSFRGKRWPYFICPEGGRRMTNISVFCHEFGHMLGLPDLYARPENPGSEGASVWCAMSNQVGYGRPQHFSAWCKERLGWLKPAVIDPRVKQKLVLNPVEGTTDQCYKVLLRRDGSEYLLLENRRKIGFDKSLPAEGLLIWRVTNNRPLLEESHGVEGPQGPTVYRDSVPYPSRSNTAFTPYTTPSSRSKLGGGLPVHITNIRELPDGRITFYIGYEFQ